MLLTLKNLQQETLKIDFDCERTVLDLKNEVFEKWGENYPVARQKLIYAGVILIDDKPLSSYNVSEDKFIVVMIPPRNTESPNNDPNNNQISVIAQNSANETLPSNQEQANVESNFVVGEDYNRSVETLMEMGYSRELVESALTASFNNPERAFEYLVNGLPDDTSNEGDPDTSQDVVTRAINTLRDNAQLLGTILQNLGITDPNIVQQITENPDPFLDTLKRVAENQRNNVPAFEGITDERLAQLASGMTPNSECASTTQSADRNADNFVPNVLNQQGLDLSEAELDAVERIKAMGFPYHRVVQAFIACEKNEELTVNYLLSNSEE